MLKHFSLLPFFRRYALKQNDDIATVLENIGDAVFAVDCHSVVTLFNRAAVRISGFTADETLGRPYHHSLRFVSGIDGTPRDGFIEETIRTGRPVRMQRDTVILRKDGTQLFVSDSCSPLKNAHGRVIGAVVVFRDITKEHEVEHSKDEFISITSHQLRSPVTALRWYGEMLLAGKAGTLNAQQSDYVGEMYRATLRMSDFIDDLLDISRIELGTFGTEVQEVALGAVITAICNDMKPQTLEKKIVLDISDEASMCTVSADPKLVAGVFQNLISNAIKYTAEGGSVSATLMRKKAGVVVRISDTGRGISTQDQKYIFKRFFRARENRYAPEVGTGLGLSIAHLFVQKIGGILWFDSELGKGSNFYVLFPSSLLTCHSDKIAEDKLDAPSRT